MTEETELSFPGGKKVDIELSGFRIESDQQPRFGGTASAPEPSELLFAAIATAAGAAAVHYWDDKDMSPDDFRVVERVSRDFRGRLEAIEIYVECPTDFPEEHSEGIKEAIEGCEVFKLFEKANASLLTVTVANKEGERGW